MPAPAALDTATPKPDSDCSSYSRYVDATISNGRDLARNIKVNSNPANTSRSFVSAYNSAVDKLNRCEQSLPDKQHRAAVMTDT